MPITEQNQRPSLTTYVRKALINISRMITKLTFRSQPTYIVFDACEKFHYFHLEPILEEFLNDPAYKVTIIKWHGFTEQDRLPGVTYINFQDFWHNWFSIYDILLTTELERKPEWFNRHAICMFHGAGPKISYITSPPINEYNYIFSVGQSTYDAQYNYVNSDVKVVKIGLPITDQLLTDKRPALPASITLNENKPTLLYAPSWALDHSLVSMDEDILNELGKITSHNIIVRPHPNLLIPERCHGKDWNIHIDKLKAKGIQISYGNDHSIYKILSYVDVLMGDISSVVYEYLVLDKPIIIYMKKDSLKAFGAEKLIEPLMRASTLLDTPSNLKPLLQQSYDISNSPGRKELLNNTLFHVGTATKYAVDFIKELN